MMGKVVTVTVQRFAILILLQNVTSYVLATKCLLCGLWQIDCERCG